MPIISPSGGGPDTDKHLWWRCVFIAAAVQPVLILLGLMFGSSFVGNILQLLLLQCLALVIQNPAPFPIFVILAPVCIVLNSLILGTVFYLVCWLKEKDY